MSLKKIVKQVVSVGLLVVLFVSCNKDNDSNSREPEVVDTSVFTLAADQEYKLESTLTVMLPLDTMSSMSVIDSIIVNWKCSTPNLVQIIEDTVFYLSEMRQNGGELMDMLYITTIAGVNTLNVGTGVLTVDLSYLRRGEWKTLRAAPREITIEKSDLIREEGVVINGITWATRNVGRTGSFVAEPDMAGLFYQWNSKINWSGLPYARNTIVPLRSNSSTITTPSRWERANDPCPGGWRMPTSEELQSLFSAGKTWQPRDGVNGYWFFEGNNLLFLPVAGYLYEREIPYLAGKNGAYWSATFAIGNNAFALNIADPDNTTTQGEAEVNTIGYGLSCRCVKE